MEVPGQALPEAKPTTKENATPPPRRATPTPSSSPSPAPMSAIMEDAAPWRAPARKSSGMLVGGVILAVAALAAAGFAVKTWFDANRDGEGELRPPAIDPSANRVVPATESSQPSPPPRTPAEDPPKAADPSPPHDVGQPKPPATMGPSHAEPVPVKWANSWRTARSLP